MSDRDGSGPETDDRSRGGDGLAETRSFDSSGTGAPANSEESAAQNPAARSWAHLELIAKVGEGGFGQTFRARDPQLGRDVALKLLKVDEQGREGLAGRVVQEGALLARVRHPNVVTVHGAQRHEGCVGLWMEFVHGRTLESLIEETGPLGEREAVMIGADLCRALAAVHAAGIIHRDIKAANVMREEGGRIVLMDFGLGEDLRTGSPDGAIPSLAGTPFYMAPELLRGERATVRSDLYGLGVLLFRLVTNRYPVTGGSLGELREAHEAGRMLRVRDARPDLSTGFVRVVERCLDHDPGKRFETPGALEAGLVNALEALAPSPAGRPEGTTGAKDQRRPDSSVDLRAAEMLEYLEGRSAEWRAPRYRLDQEFVELTLLLDRGEESEAGRWSSRPERFRSLVEILSETEDPAIVLLGPPGSGKSTLLRRLELDVCEAARSAAAIERPPGAARGRGAPTPPPDRKRRPRAGPESGTSAGAGHPVPFYCPLTRYKPARPGEPPPEPREWLAGRWSARFPDLPPLPALLPSGRMLLLLDGLNDTTAMGARGMRDAVVRWKEFLGMLVEEHPGSRVIFTCRTLDYSAPLSSPSLRVPQILIEPMTDGQVEQYLLARDPARGAGVWAELRGSSQLEAMRSPFFLSLLLEHADWGSEIPRGRSGLFTGFLRRSLRREVERDNPLFAAGDLFTERDVRRIASGKWGDPWALPDKGPLIPKLSELAYFLQDRGRSGGGSAGHVDFERALDLLDHERGEEIIKAGEALLVLDEDSARDELKFFHPLFQEYFAGRRLAERPELDCVKAPWSAQEIDPPLRDVLRRLPPAEGLPPLATTGWEETALMAGAMSNDPDGFLRTLMRANLALAGRCAAQPEVLARLSHALLDELRSGLLERSIDRQADLRSRIEAGFCLGVVGDPRFERRKGSRGDYLLPPMAAVEGGGYPMGEDEPYESMGDRWTDHMPRHVVDVRPFRIGRFPVTNAEWALFMDSGGYEDPGCWDTDAALRWQRGDGTAEGVRSQVRYWLARFRGNPEDLEARWSARAITEEIHERWKKRLAMTEEELRGHLTELFPGGPLREPLFWRDPSWNSPSQPVVGICWFEARAYARWMSIQAGQGIRLLTEAEWEAAARGRAGRAHAFGDEFDPLAANTADTRIRRTTPVGVFVEGETPEGVSDLAGNIEVWTGSLFGKGGPNDPAEFRYPYRPEDGREDDAAGSEVRRVLRGSSWTTARALVRAASRVDSAPDYRFNHVGFRLAAPI